ncbi:sensor histidine kinase [Aminomonas paucivorans]|uniref:sensor histidine kinase n=1 Tax=Aminomonas paucivorans TaxID=81412 RepID=UPI003321EABD
MARRPGRPATVGFRLSEEGRAALALTSLWVAALFLFGVLFVLLASLFWGQNSFLPRSATREVVIFAFSQPGLVEAGLVSGLLLTPLVFLFNFREARRNHDRFQTLIRSLEHLSPDDLGLPLPENPEDREMTEVTQQIRQSLMRLQVAMNQVKQQFTSDVSHELRTPLAVIKGKVEVALLKERDQDYYQERLREIGQQADLMQSMVKGLLDLARLDALARLEDAESTDLLIVAEEAVDGVLPVLSSRGQKLRQDLESAPLRGRETLLIRLCANLLENASKYSPEGGELGVSTRAEGSSAVLTVWDRGKGMDPETREKCFQPFWRGDTARATQGYGLGLPLVRRIALLHQGQIEVWSAPDSGSRFTLRFPLDTENLMQPDPGEEEEEA